MKEKDFEVVLNFCLFFEVEVEDRMGKDSREISMDYLKSRLGRGMYIQ